MFDLEGTIEGFEVGMLAKQSYTRQILFGALVPEHFSKNLMSVPDPLCA
jgi:hypothetical protein